MQPIRCYSCGKVLGNKYETYNKLREKKEDIKKIWKILGINRYCCMVLLSTSIDIEKELMKYCTK